MFLGVFDTFKIFRDLVLQLDDVFVVEQSMVVTKNFNILNRISEEGPSDFLDR